MHATSTLLSALKSAAAQPAPAMPLVENAARPRGATRRRRVHDEAPLAAPLSDDDLVAAVASASITTTEWPLD